MTRRSATSPPGTSYIHRNGFLAGGVPRRPRSWLFLIIAILAWLPAWVAKPTPAHGGDPTPREVVESWLTVYPKHLERAAELTTKAFRQGLSKAEWVEIRGAALRNLHFRYVRATIVHQDIDGEEARVVVNAHVVTLQGDHPQDEAYFLKKGPDGTWRIDRVEVYLENFNRLP